MKGANVTVAEVLKGIEEMGYEVRPAKGAFVVAVIDATEVKIPTRSPRENCSPFILSQLSKAIEISTKELLEVFLGKAIPKAGKPKAELPAASAPETPSKTTLLLLLTEVQRNAGQIEEWLRVSFGNGELGTEALKTLGRLREDLHGALNRLSPWPPAVPDSEWKPLDDAGYEPRRYDPVTTGVARATGTTARLAVRRTTATKGQLEEREDA